MLLNKKVVLRFFVIASAGFASIAAAQNFPALTALPPLDTPDTGYDEQAMAKLGSELFFDTRLSGDSSTSCASCHSPDLGWGDSAELSRGYPGTMHWRNAQTLINSAYLTEGLHWDGTVPSLEEQVPGAMATSIAHNIDPVLAEERMRQIPGYVSQFDAIWGDGPTLDRIGQAIAAFERTLVSSDSPFDAFSRGETSTFSEKALRGLFVFQGKGNCVACHNGALATDARFYNTSVPPNPAFQEDPLRQITFRAVMRGFGIDQSVYETFDRDPGRFVATGDPADLGAVRTPPLRYLKYTAPYMHNGMFYTLEEVVDFYNGGGTEDVFGTKSPLIQPLNLTDQERSDLVAFLESMSGSEILGDVPQLPDYDVVSFGTAAPQAVTNAPSNVATSGATSTASPQQASQSEGTATAMILFDSDISTSSKTVEQEAETASAGPVIVLEGGQRFVVVAEGDTLGTLAEAIYGDVLHYQTIYDANRDVIANPLGLETGLRLLLPEE